MKTRILTICAMLALPAVALATPDAAAAPGDSTDNTNAICLVPVATPLGDNGLECTRGTVAATVTPADCSFQGTTWGCNLHLTVSDTQDAGTCGQTIADTATDPLWSHGCFDSGLGFNPLGVPTPAKGDSGWTSAAFDPVVGVWKVAIPAHVKVTDAATNGPYLQKDWTAHFEVPSPPSSGGCSGGSSAAVAAGAQSTGATLTVAGETAEEYVSPAQIVSGYVPMQTDAGAAEVKANTGTMGC